MIYPPFLDWIIFVFNFRVKTDKIKSGNILTVFSLTAIMSTEKI